MAKNKTEIKTRHGLILEGLLAESLRLAGIEFEQSPQYDDTCEVPDFLLPDSKSPDIMIETHQTESRNSLMMKILRAFTAVCECKGHFGHEIKSINVVFGNTKRSFASSPMAALGAIFDATILFRELPGVRLEAEKLEMEGLKCAKTENLTVAASVAKLSKALPSELRRIGVSFANELKDTRLQSQLETLWLFEESRQSGLGLPPKSGDITYFKRAVLKSLFLEDADFEKWMKEGSLSKCSAATQKQAVLCGIAETQEGLSEDQDELVPILEVNDLLRSGQAEAMRELASKELSGSPEMEHYFADIRDAARRGVLAESFIVFLSKPSKSRLKEIKQSVDEGNWGGVDHSRNCLFDLISIVSGLTFNDFNSAIFEDERYPITLWSPYSNLVLRIGQFGKLTDASSAACEIVNEMLDEAIASGRLLISDWSNDRLAKALVEFRTANAIKLRKLDPLRAKVRAICASLDLNLKRINLENVLFDLAADAGVGRFLVYEISDVLSGQRVLLSAVAVHDNHGDDKSKEWGARRLATLYRMEKGKIRKSEYQEGIFVLDGEWKDKDVARLHRSGWTHVVRLADLEKTLKSVFGISTPKAKTTQIIPIQLPEEDDLAMAAEKEASPKLKRAKP